MIIKRMLVIFTLVLIIGSIVRAKDLPNWLSPDETKAPEISWYNPQDRNEPPDGSYLPPEYEPVQAIIIGWESYTTMLTSIAQGASAAGAEVWCAGSSAPSSISGVPSDLYQRINACPLDTVWMRDYGPYGILLPTGDSAIVDSRYRHYQYRIDDDALPCCLATEQGLGCYSINTAGGGSSWVILDGGNVMVDNAGTLYMTKRTYNWNTGLTETQVNTALMDYFGMSQVRTVNYVGYPGSPTDGTGHIDMIAKLLTDEDVLVANADGNTTYDPTLDQVALDFANWGFTVHRVNCFSSGGTWYTYTNSLIVNDRVLIPSYSGHTSENAAAVSVYQLALPDHTIVSINSDDSIVSGGSIHCVVQSIPMSLNPVTATPTIPVSTPTMSPPITSTPTNPVTSIPSSTRTSTPPAPTISPTLTPTIPGQSSSTPTQIFTQTPLPTYTSIPTSTSSPVPSWTASPTPSTTPSALHTHTPVATPTALTTSTPLPSSTPTPLPTGSPVTPTQTSSQTPALTPSMTPTQTPSFQNIGIKIEMNADHFHAGMPFHLGLSYWNSTPDDRSLPSFLILDLLGNYWFYPNWTMTVDYDTLDLTSGINVTDLAIFDFTWPDQTGALDGIRFWAALTDPELQSIVGDYDYKEWGYE